MGGCVVGSPREKNYFWSFVRGGQAPALWCVDEVPTNSFAKNVPESANCENCDENWKDALVPRPPARMQEEHGVKHQDHQQENSLPVGPEKHSVFIPRVYTSRGGREERQE